MAAEKKQSTACTVQIGPYVDKTSGDTEETALNLQPGDVFLSKNGGVFAAKTNADTCDADTKGWYRCNLGETDMNTLGELQIATHESGALYVWKDLAVVTANYWDSKYGTDKLQVDMVQIHGDDTAASNLEKYCDGDTYMNVDAMLVNGAAPLTVASIADGVWDESDTGHTTAGKAGAQIWTDVDAILVDTAVIGAAGAGLTSVALSDTSAHNVSDHVWDESDTGHTNAGKAGAQLWTDVDAILVDTAVIGAAGAGLTSVAMSDTGVLEVETAVLGDTVDTGFTVEALLKELLAKATGDMTKVGGKVSYADRDGDTLFSLTGDTDSVARS